MKTVNSISGGKTSAYMAKHYPADYEVFSLVCIDDPKCAPKDRSLVQYINAKLEKYIPTYGEFIASAEALQTLIVMHDLEQYLGKEIIWVRGVSFDDVIFKGKETVLPSRVRRYCTEKMKLLTIFMWWFSNIGEKVKMRIGFRADEFDRMLRFFNNSNPCNFSIPVRCSLKGEKRQIHELFNWRFCDFPLIRDGIEKTDINAYWRGKTVGGNLFEERRAIIFPIVSNCVGCFHKKEETLMYQALEEPDVMNWFARQELKDMGTWLDSRVLYSDIIHQANQLTDEQKRLLIFQISMIDGNAFDVGGCTD